MWKSGQVFLDTICCGVNFLFRQNIAIFFPHIVCLTSVEAVCKPWTSVCISVD